MVKIGENIILSYNETVDVINRYMWDGFYSNMTIRTSDFGKVLSNMEKIVVVYKATCGRYAYMPYQKFQWWSSTQKDEDDLMSSFLFYIKGLIDSKQGIYVSNKFNSKYNLNIPIIITDKSLSIIKSDATFAYNKDNYVDSEVGTLNNSCMRYYVDEDNDALYTVYNSTMWESAFYDDHTYSLCLVDSNNKIYARALVWYTTEGEFMDRIYWAEREQYTNYFTRYCEYNNIKYNNLLSSSYEEGRALEVQLKHSLDYYSFIPYVDTFRNSDGRYLYSYRNSNYMLHNTEGTYEEENTECCAECGDSIDLDNDNYYYYDNNSEYYCCESCLERNNLVYYEGDVWSVDDLYYCDECGEYMTNANECGCYSVCNNCEEFYVFGDGESGEEGNYCCLDCKIQVEGEKLDDEEEYNEECI